MNRTFINRTIVNRTRVNRIKRIISITVLLLIGLSGALQANVPYPDDIPIWTRLEVEKAFISRETTQANRDMFSAAEFGWHVLVNGRLVARISLYGTLYYPAAPEDEVDLVLVERDVLSDDRVSVVKMQADRNHYVLNSQGDEVTVTRERMEPDRESGVDGKPDGAIVLRAGRILQGSVDFLGGDYTDYVRVPSAPVSILVIKTMGVVLDARGDAQQAAPAVTQYPNVNRLARETIVDFPNGYGFLRIRGAIGSGKQEYRLLFAHGENRRAELLKQVLVFVRESDELQSSFRQKDFADMFMEYDSEGVPNTCRVALFQNNASERERVFCALCLYKYNRAEDIRRLNQRYANETDFYRDVLKQSYEKSTQPAE
ncbi:MAG: hypothetical protein KDK27_06225 [Leptospiraceae bacterium]|nr:hypothetical protein [Leptospiraceae bacterium]